MSRLPAPAPLVELTGWGRSRRALCQVVAPRTTLDVPALLDRGGTIMRGLGRSYGDPALNGGGQVVVSTHLDHVIAFDENTGLLTCEAGLSLDRLITLFAPRGWFPLITPGTKYVTVGGCIANDVHGKGHHSQGSFAASVHEMRLLLADGSLCTASRTENADLFWASFGGMGLLGVVLEATLQLRRIETTWYRQRSLVVRDLSELLDLMAEHDATYPYSVAWVDPTATGAHLGRGVLTVGDHATREELPKGLSRLRLGLTQRLTVPFELPEATLNGLTVRGINVAIRAMLTQGGPFAHYENFFYPLDLIGHWNRGYGPRGFTQYQFVVPRAEGRRTLPAILQAIVASGNLPFLNILKHLGAPSGGHLSFPIDGYTFAIDLPIRDGTEPLTRRLDAMVLEAVGRLYLGKDAFMTPESFRAMYPRFQEWQAIKRRVDPDGIFTSDQARRLGLV